MSDYSRCLNSRVAVEIPLWMRLHIASISWLGLRKSFTKGEDMTVRALLISNLRWVCGLAYPAIGHHQLHLRIVTYVGMMLTAHRIHYRENSSSHSTIPTSRNFSQCIRVVRSRSTSHSGIPSMTMNTRTRQVGASPDVDMVGAHP